jgi:hypothetical protein
VPSTGLAKISPLEVDGVHIGDYCGGTRRGGARMLIYLPGSSRPKYPGRDYTVARPIDWELVEARRGVPDPVLLDWLRRSGKTRTTGEPGKPAATYARVTGYLGELPPSLCLWGRSALRNILAEADETVPGDAVAGRHGWATRAAARLIELARTGCVDRSAFDAVEQKLCDIKPEGDDFGGMIAWALTNADGTSRCPEHDPEGCTYIVRDPPHPPADAQNAPSGSTTDEQAAAGAATDTEPADLVHAYVAHLATWQDGALDHAVFGLAVAVSAAGDGEPLWGQIIGSPSSGKTEVTRSLDNIASDRVDELTAPALLSWGTGRNPRPVGVLSRLGDDPTAALLTVGDFSTVLAGSDKSARDRDQLFSLLRRVYDGSAHRDIGVHGQLRWRGRLTILSACTPAIDDFTSHADALGPRWVYFRVADVRTRRASRSRRGGDLPGKRAQARKLAGEAVRAGRARLPDTELDDELLDLIDDVAEVVRHARGSVPRDGYGRRDIIGLPIIEEPYRLIAQLQQLARALLALGVDADTVQWMTVKTGLDTVPRARLAVLGVLAGGEVCTVAELARAARIGQRKVARFAAEELRSLGLACCPVEDDADVDDESEVTSRRDWQLVGGRIGELTSRVWLDQRFRDKAREVGRERETTPRPPRT